MSLAGIRDAIKTALAGVSGIDAAYDNAPEGGVTLPAAIVLPLRGRYHETFDGAMGHDLEVVFLLAEVPGFSPAAQEAMDPFLAESDGVVTPISASSVVDPANGFATTDMPIQRRSFYTQGLFWVFYYSGIGGGINYKTSADGITWNAATEIYTGGANSNRWTLFFDGANVHWTYLVGTADGLGYYRRGAPQSDGTITWAAAVQTAITPAVGGALFYPTITVDSNGCPWIGYIELNGATYSPKITMSTATDGTWATRSGFPYSVATGSSSTWAVIAVPQLAGRVFCLYGIGGVTLKGQPWTGAAWAAEEIVSADNLASCERYTAIGDGDKIVVAMQQAVTANLKHYERSSAGVWSTVATIQASAVTFSLPTLTFCAANFYICFWQDSPTANHIYYKAYRHSTWSSIVDLVDDSVAGIEANNRPEVSYAAGNNRVIISWLSGAGPYVLKVAGLVLDLTDSIMAAIERASLGSHGDAIQVMGYRDYGLLEWERKTYVGVKFDVTVWT